MGMLQLLHKLLDPGLLRLHAGLEAGDRTVVKLVRSQRRSKVRARLLQRRRGADALRASPIHDTFWG
jgi:hypothetical protein